MNPAVADGVLEVRPLSVGVQHKLKYLLAILEDQDRFPP